MKIFVAAATFLLAAASAYAQGVSVRDLTFPGTFEVVNESDSEVLLSSDVQVQRLVNGEWHNEVTDVQLMCFYNPSQVSICVKLRGGKRLQPPPWWDGLSCGSQCSASCPTTRMLSPGTFRFVVTSCSGDEVIAVGPAFDMKSPNNLNRDRRSAKPSKRSAKPSTKRSVPRT